MAKSKGYSVTIHGTIPVDFSNLKSAARTMAAIEAGRDDPAKLLKLMDAPKVLIADGDGAAAAGKAAKPGKARKGAKAAKAARKPRKKRGSAEQEPVQTDIVDAIHSASGV